MGAFWNLYRKMLPSDAKQVLGFIEGEVSAGRMTQAEAERKRAELEQDLHKFFDSEEEKADKAQG